MKREEKMELLIRLHRYYVGQEKSTVKRRQRLGSRAIKERLEAPRSLSWAAEGQPCDMGTER